MEHKIEASEDKGDVLILEPEEGKNFWQPVPANGHISVRISPDFLNVETPFSLGTQTLPPNGYVREHAHPVHDEVLHFISGEGIAVVEGVEYCAEPGVTIFVGRNRKHKFVNTSKEQDLHWLWFIQPNGLEHFFEEIGRPMQAGETPPEPFARPENILEIERRTAFVTPNKP